MCVIRLSPSSRSIPEYLQWTSHVFPSTFAVDTRYQCIWWWILLYNCPERNFLPFYILLAKGVWKGNNSPKSMWVSRWTLKCKPQPKANLWFSLCLGITWVRKILNTNWLEDSRTQDGSVHPFSSLFSLNHHSLSLSRTERWGRWSIYLTHYNSSYST